MSYVGEEPVPWSDRYLEMIGDPAHFKITEMAVVDYTNAPAETGPAGWEPLFTAGAEPPEQPTSRWALLKAVFHRGAKA